MAPHVNPSLRKRCPYLRRGGNSIIYKVTAGIVCKRPTVDGRPQFLKENHIFDILAQHSPCADLVQSFLRTEYGSFLEFMNNFSLAERLQNHQSRDPVTTRVVKVTFTEPEHLRSQWMNALTNGVAWLESLGYAHGDLRPENILLNANLHLKIADFDCTSPIGSVFEACIPPYGRLLGSEAGVDEGGAGVLGPRTEQFALGSIFYFINYGIEVYNDQDFGPKHGREVVQRLQERRFPILCKFPKIDSIIESCWHGTYSSVAQLTADMLTRTDSDTSRPGTMSETEYTEKRRICQQLLDEGILDSCNHTESY